MSLVFTSVLWIQIEDVFFGIALRHPQKQHMSIHWEVLLAFDIVSLFQIIGAKYRIACTFDDLFSDT